MDKFLSIGAVQISSSVDQDALFQASCEETSGNLWRSTLESQKRRFTAVWLTKLLQLSQKALFPAHKKLKI